MRQTVPTAPAAAWRIAVAVPALAATAMEEALAELAAATSSFETADPAIWLVEGFCDREPDRAEVAVRVDLLARVFGFAAPLPTVEAIPPTDWLAATRAAFPPFAVGRFWVHGSHVESPVPVGRLGLAIDAATAFGSGEHPTTRGCLTALQAIARRRRPGRVLDMGCGTGILAVAAARRGTARVVAADIDPEAVRVARVNTRVNGVARRVTTGLAEDYAAAPIRRGKPYDLVLANILAGPLVRLAPGLAGVLAPGGRAVLSGLLSHQQAAVLAAHRRQGLVLERRIDLPPWPTLVMRKPS